MEKEEEEEEEEEEEKEEEEEGVIGVGVFGACCGGKPEYGTSSRSIFLWIFECVLGDKDVPERKNLV